MKKPSTHKPRANAGKRPKARPALSVVARAQLAQYQPVEVALPPRGWQPPKFHEQENPHV